MYVEASEKRKPIGVLMIEHRLIERALSALEAKVQGPGFKPDVIAFAELIDFFGTYADATHHGKEEDILFVEADQSGLSEELIRTLTDLRKDHVRFRGFRRVMAEANQKIAAGDPSAAKDLIAAAKEFIPQLRRHIIQEDKVFFPGFDQTQNPEDRAAMKKEFIDFDLERIHQAYQAVVQRNE